MGLSNVELVLEQQGEWRNIASTLQLLIVESEIPMASYEEILNFQVGNKFFRKTNRTVFHR